MEQGKSIGEQILENRLHRAQQRRRTFLAIVVLAATVAFVVACGVWGAR